MTNSIKNKKKIYGLELILEVFDCDLKYLTSKEKIQEYLVKTSKIIKLERYGSPQIQRFMGGGGWDMGYSFFQFLTTSSITGHCLELEKLVFINVFSCSIFDPKKARDFTKKFFRAKKVNSKLIVH